MVTNAYGMFSASPTGTVTVDAEVLMVLRLAEVLAEVLAVLTLADVVAEVVSELDADVESVLILADVLAEVLGLLSLTITPLILTCASMFVLWSRNSSPPPKLSPNHSLPSSIHVNAGGFSPASIGMRTVTK
jgi:hypothetical protein